MLFIRKSISLHQKQQPCIVVVVSIVGRRKGKDKRINFHTNVCAFRCSFVLSHIFLAHIFGKFLFLLLFEWEILFSCVVFQGLELYKQVLTVKIFGFSMKFPLISLSGFYCILILLVNDGRSCKLGCCPIRS